ncbi:MAG TPA: T9SS type A sorting domain-containing protein [Bacteroidia bacterium]|jgi:hypothetical protein|nr:T9SS type A sorting domain-containing protein [Bacteroidia bacterium]
MKFSLQLKAILVCFSIFITITVNAQTTWIVGSYVGNGTSQSITGLSFKPDAIIIKGTNAVSSFVKISTMAANESRAFQSTGNFVTNAITSFDANGFSVGANAGVNTSSITYYFTAFKISSTMVVGTYTGNDAATRTIASTGSVNTKWVIIIPSSTYGGSMSWITSSTGNGHIYDEDNANYNSKWADPAPNASPTTGFLVYKGVVNNYAYNNNSGPTYHYFGFVEKANEVDVGMYTGNNTDNRSINIGFKPKMMIIANGPPTTVIRNSVLSGDASQYMRAISNASNMIQSFTATGFTVGTGMDANINFYSYLALGGAAGGILPIELLHFYAQRTHENEVQINWSTASEENNDYFTIERSEDGVSFEPVGKVEGAGNSIERINYQFTDENTPTDKTLYYRLKQTDNDGVFKTFTVTAVSGNAKNTFDAKIVQNPIADNEIVYDLNLPENATMKVQVTDNLGNILNTETYYYSRGTNRYSLDAGNLQSGVYVLTIKSLDGIGGKSIRFVVSK